VAINFEAIVNAEQSANDQSAQGTQSVNEHVRLARKLAEPADWRPIEIAGGIVAPLFHFSG
jgi:hypothetical protein